MNGSLETVDNRPAVRIEGDLEMEQGSHRAVRVSRRGGRWGAGGG
jgi:hypothetical protein